MSVFNVFAAVFILLFGIASGIQLYSAVEGYNDRIENFFTLLSVISLAAFIFIAIHVNLNQDVYFPGNYCIIKISQ